MSFNADQVKLLSADLNRAHVKGRSQGARTVSYIEGWHAIAEANRIFGFDAWLRETVDIRVVSEAPREIGQDKKAGWGVTYIARVRITVGNVVREGVGAGHGIDVDLGQAHESAIKEAETDAMKRALMTFGNPFGLALYDKTQANVSDGHKEEPAREETPFDDKPTMTPDEYVAKSTTFIRTSTTTADIAKKWWASEKSTRQSVGLSQDHIDILKREMELRFAAKKDRAA